ncbi:hypothetical protein [Protofrankia symbiont of Coriaria ruscifolia]|uniref:hypothetical protein n=1 Tax=Protofrankia symbiont of Coriaria ruscifolia TaxID=1306542 RepID=UPI0010416ADB|nr:hypothetical protein [Protofrankia symbiont of Coriaria ruscifolia]
MARLTRSGAAFFAALLVAGAAGCTRSESTGGPPPTPTGSGTVAPSPKPSATDAGVPYALPKKLCEAVDDTALKEIFPIGGGQPITDAPGLCATSRATPTMAVSFSVNAELLRDATWAERFVDTGRRLAKGTPTDVPGVGSAAYWVGDKNKVELTTSHGNLVLKILCETVNDRHRLPADVPARLGQVANATFMRLAP